ncbi:MAG: sulfurtransferase [Acidobacteriota bacterium]
MPAMFTTLVAPATLAAHLDDSAWVIVDCRFDLANPDAGEARYAAGHIPGARYAHLDRDLSGAKTGVNGRHPLPSPEQAAARFGALGIGPGCQVIAYDADMSMYAARLWWMLRWLGHDAVAVLDGGLARWAADGYPLRGGRESWTPATFRPAPRRDWCVSARDVAAGLGAGGPLLVDARASDRFRGENETIDPVAGHIPGARNYFYQQNLDPQQRFRSPEALRAAWTAVLAGRDPRESVMYCGSGVTACHNLLALEVAGLPGARLFAGSWSEWSQDPARPIATGDE